MSDRKQILLVEDDAGVREMLAVALESEGFSVMEAGSAEGGLELLQQFSFDIVLTDYSLPRGDGAWMLREATQRGWLSNTPAFMVTAHYDQAFGPDYPVIPKPLDLDHLVATVRTAIRDATDRRDRHRKTRTRANDRGATERPGNGRGPTPLDLVLYISSASPHAAAAIRNVKKALGAFDAVPVHLTVRDLAKHPDGDAELDRVHFTPSLFSPGPGPRTWIVGHLDNPRVLLELLESLVMHQQ